MMGEFQSVEDYNQHVALRHAVVFGHKDRSSSSTGFCGHGKNRTQFWNQTPRSGVPMKFLLIPAAVLLFGLHYSHAEEEQAPSHGHWFCTAEGINAQNQRMSVSGDYKETEAEARQSAKQICRQFGLAACSANSCFNLEN